MNKRTRLPIENVWGRIIPQIPWWNSNRLVMLLSQNVSRLLNDSINCDIAAIEKEIDSICYQLFDLTESEINEIETTLSVHTLRTPVKGGIE